MEGKFTNKGSANHYNIDQFSQNKTVDTCALDIITCKQCLECYVHFFICSNYLFDCSTDLIPTLHCLTCYQDI